ncbi:30S ribosomal protein S9 [Candidatus Daviesbacteria bacterium]|nr:30S ribosomal protein S9 [Candidatus Daviesbacteria bacterium]
MIDKNYTQATGRRKEAIARVRIFKGQGPLIINNKPVSEYFRGPVAQKIYQKPLELTQTLGQFTATVKIVGGGRASQLGALVHGLARALNKIDRDKFRAILKKNGLLTRDARVKERRKFGLAHKARAKKQSPKR